MDQIVDYPASDMTITVGSGMTVARFNKTLAEHGQRMPVDVPQRETATLGGVVATNFSGPRRYGCGTLRDYLIGIEAVDAHGEKFKGGGRVVKNVAGYDFCRLLIGSLGTLGIITQLTFKLRPVVRDSRIVACGLRDWAHAERLLAALVESPTTPTAIEVVAGPEWHADETLGDLFGADLVAVLLVCLEGTSAEVTLMLDTLGAEWNALDTRKNHFSYEITVTCHFPHVAGPGCHRKPRNRRAKLIPPCIDPGFRNIIRVARYLVEPVHDLNQGTLQIGFDRE